MAIIAKASDIKFAMQLEFAKWHYRITLEGKNIVAV